MTDKNGKFLQVVPLVIAGLIFIINGFALFWLADVKGDVRELRQNYFNALSEVSQLKGEIKILNFRIEVLNTQIVDLREQLEEKKKP